MHQRYVDNRTAGARFCGFLAWSIAHREAINSVDRHLMVDYQITYDRIRHVLRFLYSCLALARRVSLHFNDVTFLSL